MKKNIKGVFNAFSKIVWLYVIVLILIVVGFCVYRVCITKAYPLKYKNEICYYADNYDLDRALVLSVVKVESGFDKNAVSGAGAIGLMQITEKTGEYIASKLGVLDYDLTNVKDNLNFGCFYLKYLLTKFSDIQTALIAYNAGEGRVVKWLKDSKFSDDGIRLKTIPYKETRDYITKINKNFSKYKELYKNFLDK